ncbi:hypothetical protein [Polaribacter sp. Hel_I_88]|uniref:hypothetical protein n=1 Tax=Polaribacter sp. Hel_I_88 TaxID=1250006 RepID=UPI00047D572C|nr:hypothetical protein [Polaribacter sp. Hel_I_88]|tara:strand:- start:824 stop:1168 length:345 start_codon:yes stop_codon:yes gene_type:complete
MRKLKSIITIIAISLATTFSTTASEKEPSKITKELRTEIVELLGSKIPIEFKKTEKVEISFMINNENEIIVISVDSELADFNSYIKKQLNYKKVKVKGTIKGEVYKIPVTANKK